MNSNTNTILNLVLTMLVTGADGYVYGQQASPKWGWGPGLGLYITTVTPALARDLHLDQEKGLLVLAVVRSGPGDQAGLKPGDVITGLSDSNAWSAEGKRTRIEFVHSGRMQSAEVVSGKIAEGQPLDLVEPEVVGRPIQTYVVDAAGSGNFTTIAGALFSARVGDTISLKPGRYNESVLVRSGVIIRPVENSPVRIESDQPWLLKGPGTFDVSGLAFAGSGLRVENVDKANIANNTFVMGPQGTALWLVSSRKVTISRCSFQGTVETVGVQADHSEITVADSMFLDNGKVAVLLANNSQADIHRNLMERNTNGINATDSSLVAERNTMAGVWGPDRKDDSNSAVWAGKSAATINKNFVRRYSRGIQLINASVPAVISDNTVTQSMYAVVVLGSGASLNKNLLIQNSGDGVYVGVPQKADAITTAEVTINQNTISQNDGTAINAEAFGHLTVKENLIEANHWGIRVDNVPAASLENNTVVLQTSTGINVRGQTDVRIYNNIVAFNGFGIFADVSSHRESGYNDVFGNLVSTDFPLRDGNYGRYDRYTTPDHKRVPIEIYPAYDLKAATDLNIDPGFVKVGSDYSLKITSQLIEIRGQDGRYLGAYAPKSAGDPAKRLQTILDDTTRLLDLAAPDNRAETPKGTVTPRGGSDRSQCKQWVQKSVIVTFWGQDELFSDADVVANITDPSGEPNSRGRNLEISYGTHARFPFMFGLNGVPDHQLAPGESIRLTLTTPPHDTDITKQSMVVRYCREY